MSVDKRQLWLEAMRNVAIAHHKLIVDEYNRLMQDVGELVDPTLIHEDAKQWILAHLNVDNTAQKIQCIKAMRDKYHMGLKETKDVVDTVCKELIADLMIANRPY